MVDQLKQVIKFISKNEMKQAFTVATKALENHHQYSKIALLSSQFHELDERYNLSLISFEDYSIPKNKMANGFLFMINKIIEEIEDTTTTNPNSEKELLQQILKWLHRSYEGFILQIKVRDELHEMIYDRTNDVARTEYWHYFSTHYATMTEIEKILHQRIRGYTKDLIGKYNFKILDILEQHPPLISAIPDLNYLHKHLECWKSMYENEFAHNDSMSLVYLQELDQGFPSGVEKKIEARISAL
jgi:hypothetical protein